MANSTDNRRSTNAATLARSSRAAATTAATATHQFLSVFAHEHAITLKVMRAFPADKGAFQPHPRSQSAKRLMWTFVMAQDLVRAALDSDPMSSSVSPQEPTTIAEVVAAYEQGTKDVAALVARSTDAELRKTVPFLIGPDQLADVPLLDIMWLMLMDSIHHRGQLSVYVRMTGGLVPSIYGPSADEPWM